MANTDGPVLGAKLTGRQYQFLAARLLCETDREAAEQIGLDNARPSDWRRNNPNFDAAYIKCFEEQVEFAKDYAKQALLAAVQTLVEGLGAVDQWLRPDWKTRIAAARLLLQSHGLLLERVDMTSGGKSLRIVIEDGGKAIESPKVTALPPGRVDGDGHVDGEYRIKAESDAK